MSHTSSQVRDEQVHRFTSEREVPDRESDVVAYHHGLTISLALILIFIITILTYTVKV